jgi:polyisoprenoid-binding protein YceI
MKRLALAVALSLFAAAAFATPATYKIDPDHTVVLASWNHFGFSNPSANFGKAEGAIVYDAADVGASSVEVTLPLDGLDTFVPALDEHLKGADFFDAAKFPTITFKSTKVEAAGAGKLRVSGNLTVKGVTRPAVLDVTLNKAAEQPMLKTPAIGFDATATIKRSEFGISQYVPMVSDDIGLRITTEAMVPKAAAAQ